MQLENKWYIIALSTTLLFVPHLAYGLEITATPTVDSFGPNDSINILVEIDEILVGGSMQWVAQMPDGSIDSGFLDNFKAKKKIHIIPRDAFDNQFGTWTFTYSAGDASETIPVTVIPLILEITTDKQKYLPGDEAIITVTTNYYEPYSALAEQFFIKFHDSQNVLLDHMENYVMKASQPTTTLKFLINELLANYAFGQYKLVIQYYNTFADTTFEVPRDFFTTSIFVGTDKSAYNEGEIVELNLVIPKLLDSNAVVKITDPSGKITTRNLSIDTTLTRVFLDDVSTKLPGTYIIEIEYAGIEETSTFVVESEDSKPKTSNIEFLVSLDKQQYRPGEVLTANVNAASLIVDKITYWFEDPVGNKGMQIIIPMTSGTTSIPINIPNNALQGPWKMYVELGGDVEFAIFFVAGNPIEHTEIVATEEQTGPELLMTIEGDNVNLNEPYGIALDSNQDIYVVDSGNSEIKKFDSSGYLLNSWGTFGSDEGEFKNPIGIFIDSDFVHIADTGNSRIQTFDNDGTFIKSWGFSTIESQTLRNPVAISVDDSGIFYVADFNLNKIPKFDSEGNYSGHIESLLTASAKFSSSEFIVSHNNRDFFILDSNNNRVLQYRFDGNFIKFFGATGEDDGKFLDPSALAVDSIGNLYVADTGNHRIQVFDSKGKFVAKWGSLGTGAGEFNKITGIALDYLNNIYVVDSANNRIQKFAPFVITSELKIPDWVRNNAKWWSQGTINDNEFANGLQFMINEKIIVIPDLAESGQSVDQKIPEWIKSNAEWWADGQISDKEFASGIEYLVKQGIIRI